MFRRNYKFSIRKYEAKLKASTKRLLFLRWYLIFIASTCAVNGYLNVTFESGPNDASDSERFGTYWNDISKRIPRDAHGRRSVVRNRKILSETQVPPSRDKPLRKYKKPLGENVTAGARKFTAVDKLMSPDYGSGPQGKISVEDRRSRFQNLF